MACFFFFVLLLRHSIYLLEIALIHVTSGFRLEVSENCALLRCYATSSGNSLPTFRDNLSVKKIQDEIFDFLKLEDGPVRLPQNVGK